MNRDLGFASTSIEAAPRQVGIFRKNKVVEVAVGVYTTALFSGVGVGQV